MFVWLLPPYIQHPHYKTSPIFILQFILNSPDKKVILNHTRSDLNRKYSAIQLAREARVGSQLQYFISLSSLEYTWGYDLITTRRVQWFPAGQPHTAICSVDMPDRIMLKMSWLSICLEEQHCSPLGGIHRNSCHIHHVFSLPFYMRK